MPYFNNNLFKTNADIIYVNDLDLLNNNLASIDPGTLVLYSYDYNTVKGFKEVRGSSYELYFVSEDGTLKQLSYNIFPGNGLAIDKHGLMSIGIDNNTIIRNQKNELMYDYKKFKTSYGGYIKGLLKGDNLPYHDSLINNFNEHGYIASDNGIIYMNNGLSMALYDIEDYIEKINKMFSDIEAILMTLQVGKEIFYVGDLLYRTPDGIITSFKGRNIPYMICVIASGVEPDGYARFIPLNYKLKDSLYALQEDYFMVKNTYSQIPIYNINEYNRAILENGEPSIIGVTYGYIATDQTNWSLHYDNPLVGKYYYFGSGEQQQSSGGNHKWYIDPQLMHQSALYSLGSGAMTSEIISDLNIIGDMTIYVSISITFSDGFVGKYNNILFKYDTSNRKFINTSTIEADQNSVISSDIMNSNTTGNYSQYTPNIYLQENEMQNLVDQNYINNIDINQYLKDNENLFSARDTVAPEAAVAELADLVNQIRFSNERIYGCGGGGGGGCSRNTNSNSCGSLYTCVAQSSSSSSSTNTCSSNCTNYEYDCPSGVNCSFFGVPNINICDSLTAPRACTSDCSSHCAQYTAPVALKSYIFKLIMPAGLIDMDYGYLEFYYVTSKNQSINQSTKKIFTGDSNDFPHYNKSTGNTYIFTSWANNLLTDGIKIVWHASKNWKSWGYDTGIIQNAFMADSTKTELISDNKYYKIIDLNNNFELNKIQFNAVINMRPTSAMITQQPAVTVKFNTNGIISASSSIIKYTYGLNCSGFQKNIINVNSIYINTNNNPAFMTGVNYYPNIILYFSDGAYVNITNAKFILIQGSKISNNVQINVTNINNSNSGKIYTSSDISRIIITGIRRNNESQDFISSTFMDNVGKLENI